MNRPIPLVTHPPSGSPPPAYAAAATPLQAFRSLERQRRLFARTLAMRTLPRQALVELTLASFRMEQIATDYQEIAHALARTPNCTGLRSPHLLRIRNHIAILLRIDQALARREDLQPMGVLRWYTSLSRGLSIAGVDPSRVDRLAVRLRQINSPALIVQSALPQIAAAHAQLLCDPIFPGFNGILARLLLRYHLGRCLLPPVVFDPDRDRAVALAPGTLLPRLVELLTEAYQRLSR